MVRAAHHSSRRTHGEWRPGSAGWRLQRCAHAAGYLSHALARQQRAHSTREPASIRAFALARLDRRYAQASPYRPTLDILGLQIRAPGKRQRHATRPLPALTEDREPA